MSRIRFDKPLRMLTQFTDLRSAEARDTLSGYIDLPEVHPERLDREGEGLLLLTDDGRMQAQIADPQCKTLKA